MATLVYDSTIVPASSFSMLLRPNVLAFTSPLSNAIQTLEVPWPRWEARLGYIDMTTAQGRALDAFLRRVGGPAGRILMWDLRQSAPAGTQRGTLTLSGAHAQGATTLALAGTTAGATLKAGDKLGIGAAGGQVVEVAANASFTGSGDTIAITQPLRTAPGNGTAVVWDKPSFTGQLQDVPVVTHFPGYSRCDSGLTLIETF